MNGKRLANALVAFVFTVSLQSQIIFPAFGAELPVPANLNKTNTSQVQMDSFAGHEEENGVYAPYLYVNPGDNSFAIFPSGRTIDIPQMIGQVRWERNAPKFYPQLSIQEFSQYYLLRSMTQGTMSVIERLPEGGFGRLLRYQGPARQYGWVDLEFIYEDGTKQVTVLDHQKEAYFRTTFLEELHQPGAFSPDKDPNRIEEMRATVNSGVKKLFWGKQNLHQPVLLPSFNLMPNLIGTSGIDAWISLLLRGPPGEALLT